jgi:hypothetical protein
VSTINAAAGLFLTDMKLVISLDLHSGAVELKFRVHAYSVQHWWLVKNHLGTADVAAVLGASEESRYTNVASAMGIRFG